MDIHLCQCVKWSILLVLLFSFSISADDAVFLEFPGLAVIGSIHYEFNLTERQNYAWYIRTGFGYHTCVLTWSHLHRVASKHKFIETGVGTVIWYYEGLHISYIGLNLGIRYQNEFLFRLAGQGVFLLPCGDPALFGFFKGKVYRGLQSVPVTVSNGRLFIDPDVLNGSRRHCCDLKQTIVHPV